MSATDVLRSDLGRIRHCPCTAKRLYALRKVVEHLAHDSCGVPLVALVALPDGHGLAWRKSVEIAELVDEQVLLLRKEFMTRQPFDGACQVAHVSRTSPS